MATGAVAAVLVLGATVGVVAIVDRDGGNDRDLHVATDATAPAKRLPDDPAAARSEIERVLAGPFRTDGIEFVSANEALVNVTEVDVAPGAVPRAYTGLRMGVVGDTDRWALASASACRIPDFDPTGGSCGRDTPEVRITEGATSLDPEAYAGIAPPIERIALRPDEGYVRGPLVAGDGVVWAAGYDRAGATYTFPPSRVVAFDPASGAVATRIDLRGETQSLTEGEGARWAVTRDKEVTDAEFRVKRIELDGAGEPVTMPIPLEEVPAGPVAAGAGGVWVPVRDGVLRFDADSGEFAGKVELGGDQERRGVAIIDGGAWVTTGTTLQRLDTEGVVKSRLDTFARSPLTDVVLSDDAVWALASASRELFRFELDPGLASVEAPVVLPGSLQGASLHAGAGRVWVTGTADLAPAGPGATSVAVETVVLPVEGGAIAGTILVAGATDATVVLDSGGDPIVTSGGDVYGTSLRP
jgi:hypothetical protein